MAEPNPRLAVYPGTFDPLTRGHMVVAWIITIPASALVAGLVFYALQAIGVKG